MNTWNRRQVRGLIVAIAAFFLLVIPSAGVGPTSLQPAEAELASPTPALAAAETPVPMPTAEGALAEPEATSQPEEEAAPGTTDDGEEEVEIIVSRRPIPTLSPAG